MVLLLLIMTIGIPGAITLEAPGWVLAVLVIAAILQAVRLGEQHKDRKIRGK